MQSDSGNRDSVKRVVVIGAGPAGLTAGYELSKLGLHPTVLEKAATVGGLARTDNYRGFHFDMGGHRFFTKVKPVQDMWKEVLGGEFLRRPRMSRIYYNGKYFDYPLKPWNALLGLGFFQSILVGMSYLHAQIFPHRKEETFEQWVTNRFGKRLFATFFKTYTEKVWGIPCSQLKAEWAAQRIKDLSLKSAILSMFFKPKKTIKTLIEEFDYPRLGPGMMWRAVTAAIEARGGTVRLNSGVLSVKREGNRITSVVAGDGNSSREEIEGDDFISSMPVTELIKAMDPPPAAEVLEAADKLSYRDFLTVCLIVNKRDLFPDNWIYIHDPDVHVGRIQNYRNWSPDMIPNEEQSSLGLEYFCTEGDEVWCTPDEDLIELGKREVEHIGLASYEDVVDGCVVRVEKAYPVYDEAYAQYLSTIREFVDGLENLQTIGRNGLHRYNNQDHAMLTGMYAVENLMFDRNHDLWAVNTDGEYHEEITEAESEALGWAAAEGAPSMEGVVEQVFSKLDRVAFGLACGTVAGAGLFLATLILVLKGGQDVGANLSLLSNYFPGYTVTVLGSLLGLVYGFFGGFVTGYGFAFLRNLTAFLYMALVRRRAERKLLRSLLDHI